MRVTLKKICGALYNNEKSQIIIIINYEDIDVQTFFFLDLILYDEIINNITKKNI